MPPYVSIVLLHGCAVFFDRAHSELRVWIVPDQLIFSVEVQAICLPVSVTGLACDRAADDYAVLHIDVDQALPIERGALPLELRGTWGRSCRQ